VRPVSAGRRVALLAAITVVGAVLALAQSLWPVLGPLTQRTALPAASRSIYGVPVPEVGRRCGTQDVAVPGSVRWCLPGGVSTATVARWYADALPPGRDAGDLRWCVEQYLTDGSRRALWASDGGLVGYVLPPARARQGGPSFGDGTAVKVVRLAGLPCHPATRAGREGP
jgi:hypothetical protein